MQINIYKNSNKISKDKILFLSLKHLQYVLTENMGSGITYAEGGWVTLTVQSLSQIVLLIFGFFQFVSFRFAYKMFPFALNWNMRNQPYFSLFCIAHFFSSVSLRFASLRLEAKWGDTLFRTLSLKVTCSWLHVSHVVINFLKKGNMFIVACQSCLLLTL